MSTFKGAEDSAYNISWSVTREQHPDKDLEYDLKTLRSRSHQSIRDNLVVSGIQQAYLNYILSYGPTIYSASNNRVQKDQINSMLKERLENCDTTGSKSLYKLLEEIVSCAFADGDLVINLPLQDGNTVVELIEAHRIDTPVDFKTGDNKHLIRHGVKYDRNGKIIGFYVKKADALEYAYRNSAKEFDFFPVWLEDDGYSRKVTELFKAPLNSRPLASRQYPLTTPMLPFLKNMDDYQEAVIIGARVAACFSAFVKTTNPNAARKSMSEADPDTSTGKKLVKMRPGSIMYLKTGEEVSFASPNKPSDNHDDFVLRSHKTISMAFRLPYILAFLDTEQVSYSAFRGAVLDSFKLVKRWRRELTKIILWIVNTFVLEGISYGSIRGSLSTADIRIRWPSSGVLDSEKESRGDKVDLQNGTKSRQMICDERGIDYEEVKKDLLEEALADVERQAEVLKKQKELSEKHGIIFPETVQPEDDRQTDRRPGEQSGSDLDEEDAKERRKEDGNW